MRPLALALLVSLALALAPTARASEAPADSLVHLAVVAPGRHAVAKRAPLEALVPDIADHPYRLDPGPRPYQNRLAVTPAFGELGSQRLFALSIAYNPSPWLGYEASIGHNPGQSVHAVLHSLNAVLRHPFPGRFQPYGRVGYGMLMVSPGQSVNADQVTKNALTAGGGLEVYIRSDLALRADVQRTPPCSEGKATTTASSHSTTCSRRSGCLLPLDQALTER